mgnify:CR=1 FL=1
MLKKIKNYKIGLLLHNRNINYGHKVLISKLKKEIDCQITIILDKPLKKNRIFFILEFYKYIDRKVFSIFSNIQDPFKLVNIDSSQKKISFNEFNKSNKELNLILDLRENQDNQECLLAKKIWRLNLASFNNFFSDVVNKNRSIKTYLVQTMENKTPFILHESLNRVTKYSFHINRSEIYLGWVDRLPMLISKFYEKKIINKKILTNIIKVNVIQNNKNIIKFFNYIVYEIINKLFKFALGRNIWFIGINLKEENFIGNFSNNFFQVKNKFNEYLADPFLFTYENKSYLFCESYDFIKKKGVIKSGLINEKGECHNLEIALEELHHLSFPYIFNDNGEIYMIPESAKNESVNLYKCLKFPHEWTLEKKILSNVKAVDTSILFYENIYWLFTTVVDLQGTSSDLHIYYADNLLGEWMPHKNNPIFSDVSRSRNAGRIAIYKDNILRPSQSCLTRYGEKVVFNKIDILNKDAFKESFYDEIDCKSIPNADGLHTWNKNKDFLAFDYAKWQPRYINIWNKLNDKS